MNQSAGQMPNIFQLWLRLAWALTATAATVFAAAVVQVVPDSFAEFNSAGSVCRRFGDRYIHNYIQYECFMSAASDAIAPSDLAVGQLVGKPIGCVPTNATAGPVILPGAAFTGQHFRYECKRSRTNAVSLRITHCVDNDGRLVRIGDFFTEALSTNANTDTTADATTLAATTSSVECVGDAFLAKKIVHKWSKCRLKNGETLTEGNFVFQDVSHNGPSTTVQRSEIVSCVRESGQVVLKCTGCVATTGEQVAVAKYFRMDGLGQWTQCRRLKNECRFINVSSDYIDCEYKGQKYAHDSSFKSESGLSTFHCYYGVVSKKGCLINGNLVLVGDVRYVDDRPLLCTQSDQLIQFDGIVGCDLPSGKFRRFLEVWRDDRVMKRCTWATPTAADTSVAESRVISFACIDGKEIIPLNKVVQRSNGEYHKCAPPLSAGDTLPSDDFVEGDVLLEMRPLSVEELSEFLKYKNSRLDLLEYFGVGARSSSNEVQPSVRSHLPVDACEDILSFCPRLKDYCNSVEGDQFAELGLAIERSDSSADDYEQLVSAPPASRKSSRPKECENELTPFQKLQSLVQISCVKTCRKCNKTTENQKERLISNLERTSHCGR